MNFDIYKYIMVFLLPSLSLVTCKKKTIDVKKTFVFGPAFNANVVLPSRYFYIHAVDTSGKNFTHSPGKDAFTLILTSPSSNRVRASRQILDRNDGSFIVRFRLVASYKDLVIEVRHAGQHVADSPYVVRDTSYHEHCYCPEENDENWLNEMKCNSQLPKQIIEDLKPFPSIDLNQMYKNGLERYGKNNALCHYSIIDNEIYRKCYGEHVGFAMFMDAWLLSLTRKVQFPDMEFFSNLGDWPLSKRATKDPVPIFSWCGSDDTYDFVMPTYDMTESTLESQGRVSLDMQSVQGNTGPKWKQKISKGFFRGRDSRKERLELTVLGRSKPDIFDVGLTNFFFFKHDEEKYGPKNKHISFFDFFRYKYQLNVDGTVAAYRFPYLLVGDSLVFKQESTYYEFFYNELLPWVHYVPFKHNLEDIEKQILWAKTNDKEAKKISQAGQTFARDNLMADKLYCYSYQLFKINHWLENVSAFENLYKFEYSKRLVGKPQVKKDMEHIKQPDDHESACSCERRQSYRQSKESQASNEEKKRKKLTEETQHEEL